MQVSGKLGRVLGDGYLAVVRWPLPPVRVRPILARRANIEMKDVKVGDLWENPTDASHIVGSNGVVKTNFYEGLFYR
jgi:hypothetical protein